MALAHHLHLHRDRGKRFCPAMKEWCTKGWTPGMGVSADGFPIEGACAAWQPVMLKVNGVDEDVFDCSTYGWPADLMAELANEISHATQSTDKVANQVAGSRMEFISALPAEAHDRMASRLPRLLDEIRARPAIPLNGGTNGAE